MHLSGRTSLPDESEKLLPDESAPYIPRYTAGQENGQQHTPTEIVEPIAIIGIGKSCSPLLAEQ